MGRITSLLMIVGLFLLGCQRVSEQPLQSDDFAAQPGQIIHHVFFWLNNMLQGARTLPTLVLS